MSTNATIAMVDGTACRAVYLHWDGYLSWTGIILHDHYDTTEKVESLIALGALSALRERLAPEPGEPHSFENPAEDVTIAYARDRGEPLEQRTIPKSQLPDDERAFIQQLADISGGNYVYLFDVQKGKWLVGTTFGYSESERQDRPDAVPYVWYPLDNWF